MSDPVTRNLVILLTDIKGFTDRTSQQSRAEIQQLLERHKEVVLPVLRSKGGTLVKTMGDAFLMTYESPTNAVLAGIEVQAALRRYNSGKPPQERIEIRVAINQGEVNIADNDVFGEAVNITARIEAIADAGDVFFTEGVYLAMNKKEVPSSEVGLLQLKGIPEKVRVYKVKTETPVKSLADAALPGGLPRAAEPPSPGPAAAPAVRSAALFGAVVVVCLAVGAAVLLTRARRRAAPMPAAPHTLSVRVADGSATFAQAFKVSEGRHGNFVGPVMSLDGRTRRQGTLNVELVPVEGKRDEFDVTYQLDVSGEAKAEASWLKVRGEVRMRSGAGLTTVECGAWTVDLALDGSAVGKTPWGAGAGPDNYRMTANLSNGRSEMKCREVLKLGAQGGVEEGLRAGERPRFIFNHELTPLAEKGSVNIEFQLEYRSSPQADLLQVQNQEALVLGRPSRTQVSGSQLDLLAESAAPGAPR